MVRNGLENAFTYAKNRIEVEVRDLDDRLIEIRIHDDGEGFSPDTLASFGERRDQHRSRKTKDNRISLGLGSVIMKSVATLHGGKITASNSPNGGAVISIVLPKNA
jgi:signal transduction histidine kinase